MEHYLVINDWALEGVGEQEINVLCVEHSYEKAKELFDTIVATEKELAKEKGWEIYEDDECEFKAGEDGYYNSNHTRLYILICR